MFRRRLTRILTKINFSFCQQAKSEQKDSVQTNPDPKELIHLRKTLTYLQCPISKKRLKVHKLDEKGNGSALSEKVSDENPVSISYPVVNWKVHLRSIDASIAQEQKPNN